MRFIWMHKADEASEADVPPSAELIARVGRLMEEMAKSGVLLAGEGLQPSSTRVRLKFSGGERTLTQGPLSGSNEVLAEFAIVRMKSMDEAIEYASRFGRAAGEAEIDIGQVKEPWDLGLCPKPPEPTTRFMIMHKADRNFEAGPVADSSEINLIETLTEEKADALLSAERLQPSSMGKRLRFSEGKFRIIDGPFTESKELIGGYCIVEVKSRDDAIAWALRFAQVLGGSRVDGEVELDLLPLYERSSSAGLGEGFQFR